MPIPTDIHLDLDLDQQLEAALAAAERAAHYIQSKVGAVADARRKIDGAGDTPASQVVTEVDLEAQRLIHEVLHPTLARDGIGWLSEESEDDSTRLEAPCFWCVDPLDGTLPFIEGSPGYSVSIALVSRDGTPLIGVVADPATGETYHAVTGRGAFLNGAPLPTEARPPARGKPSSQLAPEPLIWRMDRSMSQHPRWTDIEIAIEALAAEQGCAGVVPVSHAGSALNGCAVTRHATAVYFKLPKPSRGGGSFWDFAASACLLSEFGVPATDIHGHPLELNRPGHTFMNEKGVIYASNTELAQAIVERMARDFLDGSAT